MNIQIYNKTYLIKLPYLAICIFLLNQTLPVNATETVKTEVTPVTYKVYGKNSEKSLSDSIKLGQWITGEHIEPASLSKWGNGKCFKEHVINEQIFKRIFKKSYKADCTVPLNELRYLTILHYNLKQEICLGELICHKDISSDLLDIFRELYNAHYPIERMQLIDDFNADDETSMQANNTSCFNFRRVAGSKVLSNHSTGHAIDINPLYNPYVKKRNGQVFYQPKNGKIYTNRNAKFPYKIDRNDLCYKLFKKHGFTWGGDWKSVKDFQHFEKNI